MSEFDFKEEFGVSKWQAFKGLWVIVGILALLAVVGIGFQYIGKMGERVVFTTSHQYKEAMIDRARTWEAELAGIETRLLDGSLDEATRKNLEAQKAVLNVQLQSARRD